MRKGLDFVYERCVVATINQQSGNREGDKMKDSNKDRTEQAQQEAMLRLEAALEATDMDQDATEDDPFANDFYYDSWWNQFRGPWLKSENMSDEQIRQRVDDAWECGDYKEMINLMAELICRLEQKS